MATSRRAATPKAGARAATGQAPHAAPTSVQGQGLAPMPAPARPRAGVAQIPRSTLDDPWRDLHPARVWPD